ncbi:MAG: type II toxin-antitoxin system RelE/ParE family toxin [Burkholderiaceae bacterium]|jgi:plasmid stabilization system protein ParE|nr:type II toxin-antitoxin system RelE/ParE family toxin [Burkholderiaceae bacterium]
MALKVKIAAHAANQICKAAEWWLLNRPVAPGAIGTDFGEAVALLAEQPGIGAKYQGSKTPGVRRLFLSRVRYFIYYKVEADTLQVLAFWHASREQQPLL